MGDDRHAGEPHESDGDSAELRTAVGDVAYRITHDLSDTADDLRDAAAFAPVALIKGLTVLASAARPHPRKLVIAALSFVALAIALRRGRGRRIINDRATSQGGGPELPSARSAANRRG